MKTSQPYDEDDPLYIQVTDLQHPIHLMYHVTFPDGYQNIFFSDAETGEWIEEDLGKTQLAKEIGACLKPDGKSDKILRKLCWIREQNNDSLNFLNFGFYQFHLSQYDAFEIYGPNRRYQYTIVKISEELWQVFELTGQSSCNYNKLTLELLPEILDKYIQKM